MFAVESPLDYDTLIKSDTLYPVSPDISYYCQIAMGPEQRERYAPLVDEINHDTFLPCLELAFVKAFRQWSDVRDDAASVQTLYDAAVRKTGASMQPKLMATKQIHDHIFASIRQSQRDLEAVMRVAAATIRGYLETEPLSRGETIVWVGCGAVFYALDYLMSQLDYLSDKSRPIFNMKEPEPRGIVLCLPLPATAIEWFGGEHHERHEVNQVPIVEGPGAVDTKRLDEIDNQLHDLAMKSDHIRIVGRRIEAKIVEWRFLKIGIDESKFSLAEVGTERIDRRERELLEREKRTRGFLGDANLCEQVHEAISCTHGCPVYRDRNTGEILAAELQSLFWERLRLTLMKAALAHTRGKIGVDTGKYPRVSQEMATMIEAKSNSREPLAIVIASTKDSLSLALCLIIKEHIINNGIEHLVRIRLVSTSKDMIEINSSSFFDHFVKISDLLYSLGLEISSSLIDQGIVRFTSLVEESIRGAGMIIVDDDTIERESKKVSDSIVYLPYEDKPVFVNIKTLMADNHVRDYGVFVLSAYHIQRVKMVMDEFFLPTLRRLYDPQAYVLNYSKRHFGTEAQRNAREALRSWAENSKDPSFHK